MAVMILTKVSLTPESEPQVLRDLGRIQLRGPVRQVVTRSVQGEGKAVDTSRGCSLTCCSHRTCCSGFQTALVSAGRGVASVNLGRAGSWGEEPWLCWVLGPVPAEGRHWATVP